MTNIAQKFLLTSPQKASFRSRSLSKEKSKMFINNNNLNSNPTSCSSSNSFSSCSFGSVIDSNNNQTDLQLYPKLIAEEKENCIKYGELLVLGYNGHISNNCSNNRRKSKFILKRRDKANGVKPTSQHVLQSSQEVDNLIQKNQNHSVTYTLSRNHTVVVQYSSDDKTDMFQIGRSSESAIDFIVLDTQIPNCKPQQQQSTISRFSCRIIVDREYPYTARIYAAGFDSSRRIFLGEKATKWTNDKGELDGVTTNGVLIMHPNNGFTGSDSKSNDWMEVSVCGAVFSLSESRLAPCLNKTGNSTPGKTNILKDGTLIDLCGATLLWRSVDSLKRTPTKHYLDMNLENINRLRPQCPVGLKTLIFPSSASPNALKLKSNYNISDRVPMVYLKCGHVHGHHDWGIKKDNERECPLCRKVGPYVELTIGLEPSFYCDTDLSQNDYDNNKNLFKPYAFRPCGHMASEQTCKYWSRMFVPQGTTQGLSSICPFCAVNLCKEQPYVKLIFQEGV